MYIERIKYRLEEKGELVVGYYVGKYENCEESIILDENYQPVIDGIWNYYSDDDDPIILFIPEKEYIEYMAQED